MIRLEVILLATATYATAAQTLVAPTYPSGGGEKSLEVNVIARATADATGKPGEFEVIHNDGAPSFAAAAETALRASTLDAGAGVAVWYVFKLVQPTEVHDITPGRQVLDAEPTLSAFVKPTFPPGAPSRETEVELILLIGNDGRIWDVVAGQRAADPFYFERAVAAARQFKFEPATSGGKATVTWLPFVIEFK